jgi:hypothetical protein
MTSAESSSAQQDSTPETAQAEADASSGASSFASILAKEIGDEGAKSADSGKPVEKDAKVTPSDLAAAAERLGIPVEELYKVKVPASAGREAMTIGQIKDRFTEWNSLEADRLSFSESQIQEKASIQQAKDEFKELLALIPKEQLNTANIQTAARRLAERHQAEGAKLLADMPEWKDEAKRTEELTAMEKALAGYGLPPKFTDSIRSAGLLRFIRDAVRREAQVRKALEAVRKVPKKPAPQQTNGGAPARIGQQTPSRPALKPVTERERFTAAFDKHR